jgi:hypothetical protein
MQGTGTMPSWENGSPHVTVISSPTGFLYTQSTESPSGWSAQELTAISSRSENPNQPLHAIREGSVGKRKRRTDEV